MNKRIKISEGDITESDADAIVNAANNYLWMGSGVAGAIKSKGGPEIEQEAMAQGPIPVGQAVATSAGKLPHKAVIHAAVMEQDLMTNESIIRSATASSLQLADELGLKSIDFPALGTGVGGFSLRKAAEIMIAEAERFLAVSVHIETVGFVLYGQDAYDSFLEILGKSEKHLN